MGVWSLIDFLGSLSWFGWLSMTLWFVLPVVAIWVNRDWVIDFDERKPEVMFITETVSEYGLEIPYMIVRFIVLQALLMSIGYILARLTMIQ